MIFIYRFLINIILLISPFIVFIRLMKKKESINRFKEKFCFFSHKKVNGNTIWFHGASVGELQSIIPLIEKIEKNKFVKNILVTSNTLSSSKVIKKFKFKKVIHQFFPIDTKGFSDKFLDYWKPSSAFFIDSEIWPNMIINLNKRKIPISLINARITKRSYKRWKIFPNFSKKLFSKFNFCYSASKSSKRLLKKLGVKKVKFIGNLKFSQSENEEISTNKNFKNFISAKKVWCASSTHKPEEKLCGIVHKELKKKYKNLLTIIIPRHIDRVGEISDDLKQIGLKIHLDEPKKKIQKDTDIYIVNSYGKTKSFYSMCKNVFLGGSIINHGGQNPLEAIRFGCNVLHGPNVSNFEEIYKFLKQNHISIRVQNRKKIINTLDDLFKRKTNTKKIQKKMHFIGKKILEDTYKEIILINNRYEY